MVPSKSILVATDLTTRSEPALRVAADMARITGAKLHVFHAFELAGNPYAVTPSARNAFEALLEEAKAGLAEQIRRTVENVEVASVTTELYLPWKAILHHSRAVEADLIVLGPHEHYLGDRYLGSTADRVVRFASAPCMVVRRGMRFHASHVVVALDDSGDARLGWQAAVEWAAMASRIGTCELHFIASVGTIADELVFPDLLAGACNDAREFLRDDDVNVTMELLHGESVAADIIEYCDGVECDLLVMTAPGHTAYERLIPGSVCAEVVPRVATSVLLVPANIGNAIVNVVP